VFMDYHNADGSVVEMCGNGVRVAAKLVVDHGLVPSRIDGMVQVATRAGTRAVRVHRGPDGRVDEVTVDMGPPQLEPHLVPFELDPGADPYALAHHLDVGVEMIEVSVVSMGNPHAVTVVEDVTSAPVTSLGPLVETHARFPAKVNVGFAQPLGRTAMRLRVWERGVGETQACGTGACAAVVALQRLGHLDDEVDVHVLGGVLHVTHRDGGTVTMRGAAVEVGRIELDDAWVAAAGG
jgi:diaminopimelate epimerase